ncbi:hypothetical protein B0H63DRAFT_483251 [Podospora didyma]|uniref:Uncharacterized protein n=1 Tax=Podospora didyma TaxID=330526 RepID=A0AAE0K8A7_9PEZI|nr:hypothetical protein B0H63DRAFT_483251 [Podospora didyma]
MPLQPIKIENKVLNLANIVSKVKPKVRKGFKSANNLTQSDVSGHFFHHLISGLFALNQPCQGMLIVGHVLWPDSQTRLDRLGGLPVPIHPKSFIWERCAIMVELRMQPESLVFPVELLRQRSCQAGLPSQRKYVYFVSMAAMLCAAALFSHFYTSNREINVSGLHLDAPNGDI